jgi:hypothetical protein
MSPAYQYQSRHPAAECAKIHWKNMKIVIKMRKTMSAWSKSAWQFDIARRLCWVSGKGKPGVLRGPKSLEESNSKRFSRNQMTKKPRDKCMIAFVLSRW